MMWTKYNKMMQINKLHLVNGARCLGSHCKAICKVLSYMLTKHTKKAIQDMQYLRDPIQDPPQNTSCEKYFQSLDSKWCQNMSKLSLNSVLILLNAWSMKDRKLITQSMFYKVFIERLKQCKLGKLTWNQTIQVAHFVGLTKDQNISKPILISLLNKVNHDKSLVSAPKEDICIISEACYRSGAVIPPSPLLDQINFILKTDFADLLRSPEWLVMLIKSLLISKHYNMNTLADMSSQLKSSEDQTSQLLLTTQAYVVSLYAQALVKDNQLLAIIAKSLVDKLKVIPWREQGAETHFSVGLRAKDVNTVLFSLATLTTSLHHKDITAYVEPFLQWNLDMGHLHSSPETIVEALISLWMMEYTSQYLFQRIYVMDTFNVIIAQKKNYRNLSRFGFLFECYRLENININNQQQEVNQSLSQMDVLTPSIENILQNRPFLSRMIEIVSTTCTEHFPNTKYQMEFIVPKIYVLGISLYTSGKTIHIDVLDETVCIHGTHDPAGLLMAKCRLIPKVQPTTRHQLVSSEQVACLNSTADMMAFVAELCVGNR